MPDLGEADVFYAARPVISVEGQEESNLASGLMSLLVEETTEGLYRCEASFGNWGSRAEAVGYKYFDRDKLEFGREVTIEIGSQAARGLIFAGRITGIEAHFPPPSVQPTITILAEDKLQDFRMTRRTRSFEDVSDADVFSTIASEHELQANVDASGPTYPVLAQVNQSDLAFLRERARAVDAELWLEGGALHVESRGSRRNDESPTLTYKQGLRELTICADLAGQRTSFGVSGWDVTIKEEVTHRAGEESVRSELNGNESGIALLRETFGERAEALVHAAPFNIDEARARAEASCRRMARGFVKGRGG